MVFGAKGGGGDLEYSLEKFKKNRFRSRAGVIMGAGQGKRVVLDVGEVDTRINTGKKYRRKQGIRRHGERKGNYGRGKSGRGMDSSKWV